MICANEECKREFRRADRVSSTALPGALPSVRYCSDRCKRQAGNRRYYLAHRRTMISRAQAWRAAKKK